MGNSHYDPEQFNPRDWLQVVQPNNRITLWQNKNNRNFHIEQHKIYTLDSQEMDHELDLYYRRKNHSRWVAALYFKEKGSEQFCVSRSTAHIYIEKIPIRLSDLKDLPHGDAIHIYDQCLQGYAQLASLFGCFRVHHEFIGVNQKGIVKVWAGENWSQLSIIGNKIQQQDMVRTIVDCIDSNTIRYEYSNNYSSIKNYLYRESDRLTFFQAIRQLRSYATQYNQDVIPDRLDGTYLSRHFDQFVDPLLRASGERDPYQSQSQKQNNFIPNYEPPKQESLATFRKVERLTGPSDRFQSSKQMSINNTYRSEAENNYIKGIQIKKEVSRQYKEYPGQQDSYRQPTNTRISQGYQGYQQYKISTPPMTFENRQEYKDAPKSRFAGSSSAQIKFQYRKQQSNNRISEESNRPVMLPVSNQYRPISHENSNGIRPVVPQIKFQSTQNIQQKSSAISFSRPSQPSQPSQFSQSPPSFKPQNVMSLPPQSNQSEPLKFNKPQMKGGPMPQSIIMSLYRSQDKFPGSINYNDMPTKQFGAVKRTESIREEQPYTGGSSVTLIREEEQPNPLLGIPYQANTPTTSHLQSIQQLNSEYYRYQSSNHTRQNSQLAHPLNSRANVNPSLTNSTKVNQNQFKTVNPDDGKSSPEMMKLLRQISRKQLA